MLIHAGDGSNNVGSRATRGDGENAFDIHGAVPEYVRPLFCKGTGPFRSTVLSGDPADIAMTDEAALEIFADNEPLDRSIRLGREIFARAEWPARPCWLGYRDPARRGVRVNELVRKGQVTASLHDGGYAGSGDSRDAGMVIVADGTREADERLRRAPACDPGIGVARHAGAGSPEAIRTAARHGVPVPMPHTVH